MSITEAELLSAIAAARPTKTGEGMTANELMQATGMRRARLMKWIHEGVRSKRLRVGTKDVLKIDGRTYYPATSYVAVGGKPR
jgi:hypothetical protein